jgi:predicted PurR-regulated permease PerM
MRTGLKIFLIIIVLIVGVLIIGATKAITGNSRSSGSGPFGLIIGFALLAAIRAIWKYNPDKNESSEIEKKKDDNHTLDKS